MADPLQHRPGTRLNSNSGIFCFVCYFVCLYLFYCHHRNRRGLSIVERHVGLRGEQKICTVEQTEGVNKCENKIMVAGDTDALQAFRRLQK